MISSVALSWTALSFLVRNKIPHQLIWPPWAQKVLGMHDKHPEIKRNQLSLFIKSEFDGEIRLRMKSSGLFTTRFLFRLCGTWMRWTITWSVPE